MNFSQGHSFSAPSTATKNPMSSYKRGRHVAVGGALGDGAKERVAHYNFYTFAHITTACLLTKLFDELQCAKAATRARGLRAPLAVSRDHDAS